MKVQHDLTNHASKDILKLMKKYIGNTESLVGNTESLVTLNEHILDILQNTETTFKVNVFGS